MEREKLRCFPQRELEADSLKFNFINPEINNGQDLFIVLENFLLMG